MLEQLDNAKLRLEPPHRGARELAARGQHEAGQDILVGNVLRLTG